MTLAVWVTALFLSFLLLAALWDEYGDRDD